MKIENIPMFVRQSHYKIDLTLSELEGWLTRQINQGLDIDPDFQRDHVWTKEQQSKYVEFILSGGTTGKDFYFNMPGWQSTYEGEFVLIDGKQRIAAILGFINNEVKAFGTLLNDFDKPKALLRRCTFQVHVNNLEKREEWLLWYVQFNEGGTVHTTEEIDKVKKLIKLESS